VRETPGVRQTVEHVLKKICGLSTCHYCLYARLMTG
jgi:hypothetical protein